MKRIRAIATTATLLAVLAGCSGGGVTTSSIGQTTATTSAVTTTTSREPSTTTPPESEQPPTLEPGTLSVGIYPNGMPYVGLDGDEFVGLDADILKEAAHRLGLEIKVSQMDFPALLTSIQTGRLDVAVGNIGWTPERADAGTYTDPAFYSPVGAAVRPGLTISHVDDLNGHIIGTLTGGFYTEGLRELEGVDVRVYETFEAEMLDLDLGRIDVVLYNPVSLEYLKTQRPELKFDVVFLTPPTAEEVEKRPGLSVFQPFMTGWYLGPDAEHLALALTEQIRVMYEDGTMVEMVEKWGGDPQSMLVPQPYFAERRRGVDRAADWEPPSIAD